MKKIMMLLLAVLLAATLVACDGNAPAPEQKPGDEQTPPADEVPGDDIPSDEGTQEPELQNFGLEIIDGILYIQYDGQPDENVGHYDVYFSNHALMDPISGTTEIDLSQVDLSDWDIVEIKVVAWDKNMCQKIENVITYDVPEPVVEIPAAPTVSITVKEDGAELVIQHVEGTEKYEVYVNGQFLNNCYNDGKDTATYNILPMNVEVGLNEVYVTAVNSAGTSEKSETFTVGKLADPIYHSTGTGVEIVAGDVENATGYALYGDDGEYITTIGLSGNYDFSEIYTEEGFYICHIQAVAEGWMSSEKCGIPVMIGGAGGPTGPNE